MTDTPPHAAAGSPPSRFRPLERRLAAAPTWVLTTYAVAVSFGIYFCMYAFRKAFLAASYDGVGFWGLEQKTTFIISQILGYALSKYLGIRFCSEVRRHQRPLLLIGLILAAEASLLAFGSGSPRVQLVAIFFNGLPLGMIWGLVVWYLEGRRTSEILLAGLSCSFIVSSGAVKSVGAWAMNSLDVSEAWMPAVVGALFLPAYLLFTWLVDQIPTPTRTDHAERHERTPMNDAERRAFVTRFLPGLALILVSYFFLTAYRDFRDNYQKELFAGLAAKGLVAVSESTGEVQAGAFTQSEKWVAVGVMIALAMLNGFRDNRLGLFLAFSTMACGCVLLGGCTWLLQAGRIDGMTWMILTGLGAYLAYIPYGSLLFDRIMAATRATGTAVFAIYIADAIGYTGSVGVQVYRDVFSGETPRFEFFLGFSYVMAILGAGCLMSAAAYFALLRPTTDSADSSLDVSPSAAIEPAGA